MIDTAVVIPMLLTSAFILVAIFLGCIWMKLTDIELRRINERLNKLEQEQPKC